MGPERAVHVRGILVEGLCGGDHELACFLGTYLPLNGPAHSCDYPRISFDYVRAERQKYSQVTAPRLCTFV